MKLKTICNLIDHTWIKKLQGIKLKNNGRQIAKNNKIKG